MLLPQDDPRSPLLRQFEIPTVRRVLAWTCAAVVATFVLIPIVRCAIGRSVKDYQLWYDAGRAVLAAQELYPRGNVQFPFMYPPSCAMFLAGPAAARRCALVTALSVLSCGALITSVFLSVRLAAGSSRGVPFLLYFAPGFALAAYVWSNFFLGQPSPVLLALLLAAFVCLQKGNGWFAGGLIAVAAAIKAFPVVAIVYLVYRRYWVAVVATLVTLAILLFALPAAVRGPARSVTDLKRWSAGMFRYDGSGVAQRPARSNGWKNQSVFGVANRLLRPVDVATGGPAGAVTINFATLSFRAVNMVIGGAGLLLGLIYVVVLPAGSRRDRHTDSMEYALLLLLMLMVTPLSFGYLYVWLIYPGTVIAWLLISRTHEANRGLVWWSAGAGGLLIATAVSPRQAQAYGSLFFATLLLFLGLASELLRCRSIAPTRSAPAAVA